MYRNKGKSFERAKCIYAVSIHVVLLGRRMHILSVYKAPETVLFTVDAQICLVPVCIHLFCRLSNDASGFYMCIGTLVKSL